MRSGKGGIGRPRSERARSAVFEATRALLRTDGYDRMTIDKIAGAAGVGKQTIYRWWSNKAAVVADAILDDVHARGAAPLLNTGDLGHDLSVWMGPQVEAQAQPERAALIRALTAAVSGDAALGADIYQRLTSNYRAMITDRLRAAAVSGEVRSDADLATAADALIAPFFFLIVARQQLPDGAVDKVLDIVLHGIHR